MVGLLSKVTGRKSKEAVNKDSKSFDACFAKLRALESDLREVEKTLAVLKRDVARIDRKQYRETEALPIASTSPSLVDRCLFGDK